MDMPYQYVETTTGGSNPAPNGVLRVKRTGVWNFRSLWEMVDVAKTVKQVYTLNPASSDRSRPEWSGTGSFEETLALAETGWTGADERIKKMVESIGDRLTSLVVKDKWVMDLEGSSFDLMEAMAGNPECWYKIESKLTQGLGRQVFRIVIPTGALENVSADSYTWAGAAACALVAAIEEAGHGCEIIAINQADDFSGNSIRINTVIKTADQPVDLPRIAFVAANASYHRRLCFRLREASGEVLSLQLCDGGYGRTSYNYLSSPERGDLTLPTPAAIDEFRLHGGVETQIVEWCLSQLRKVGVVPAEETYR